MSAVNNCGSTLSVPTGTSPGTVLEQEHLLQTGHLVLTHMGPTVLEKLDIIELTTARDGLLMAI